MLEQSEKNVRPNTLLALVFGIFLLGISSHIRPVQVVRHPIIPAVSADLFPVTPSDDIPLTINLIGKISEKLDAIAVGFMLEAADTSTLEILAENIESKACDIQTRTEDINTRIIDLEENINDVQTRITDIDTKVDHIFGRLQSHLIFQSDVDAGGGRHIISEAGLHCLAEDISSSADLPIIQVSSTIDSVIFDLNNHRISGIGAPAGGRMGILVRNGSERILIRNGAIGGNLDQGVIFEAGNRQSEMRDVTITDCVEGIRIGNTVPVNIDHCAIFDCGTGIIAVNARHPLIQNSIIMSTTTNDGILLEGTQRSGIINCHIYNAARNGIRLSNSQFAVIEQCVIEQSGSDGMFFTRSGTATNIVDSIVTKNGGSGITTDLVGDLLQITGCVASDNDMHGILLTGTVVSSNRKATSAIIDTVCVRNTQTGIAVGSDMAGVGLANSAIIIDCDIHDNGGDGIGMAANARSSYIRGNKIAQNSGAAYRRVGGAVDDLWNNTEAQNAGGGYVGTLPAGLVFAPTDTTFAIAGNIEE